MEQGGGEEEGDWGRLVRGRGKVVQVDIPGIFTEVQSSKSLLT